MAFANNLKIGVYSGDVITPVDSKKAATTVRIGDDEPSPVTREALENNVTVVTTIHPPILHINPPPPAPVRPIPNQASQVVIVSNENNKTLVSRSFPHLLILSADFFSILRFIQF